MSVLNSSASVTGLTEGGGSAVSSTGAWVNGDAPARISSSTSTSGSASGTTQIPDNRSRSYSASWTTNQGERIDSTNFVQNLRRDSPASAFNHQSVSALQHTPTVGSASAVTPSNTAASFPLYANTKNLESISTTTLDTGASGSPPLPSTSDARTHAHPTNIANSTSQYSHHSSVPRSSSNPSSASSFLHSTSQSGAHRPQLVQSPSPITDSFSPTLLPPSNESRSERTRTPSPLPFMGGSQSKPSSSSSTHSEPQTRPHRLQKSGPNASSTAASKTTSPSHGQPTLSVPATTRSASSPSSHSAPHQSHPSNPYPIITSSPSQGPSSSAAPTTPTSSSFGSSAATKLKRALAGKRKKSEDVTTLFRNSDGSSSSSLPNSRMHQTTTPNGTAHGVSPPPHSKDTGGSVKSSAQKQLVSIAASMLKGSSSSKDTPKVSKSTVPAPPRKDLHLNLVPSTPVSSSKGNYRGSIIQLSPGISSAVDYMRELQEQQPTRPDNWNNGDSATCAPPAHEAKFEDQSVPHPDRSVQPTSVVPISPSPATPSLNPTSSPERDKERDRERGELKESWRKSDSTISHHTVRGNVRGSRPVSMAESFQSAFTIVPSGGTGPSSIGGNKRWSTLTGDMDFGVMVEEDGEDEDSGLKTAKPNVPVEDAKHASSPSSKGSTSGSNKSKNRRSLSLNMGVSGSVKPHVTAAHVTVSGASHSETLFRPLSHSVSEGQAVSPSSSNSQHHPYSSADTAMPTTMRALPPQHHPASLESIQSLSTNKAHVPTQSQVFNQGPPQGGSNSNSSSNLRGRLAAWAPSYGFRGPSPSQRQSTAPTTMASQPGSSQTYTSAPSSFRQTTISMSNSLAPAAGLAKRAAEKINGISKKWGISTSSSGSGYSSSSSSKEVGSYSSSHSYVDQYGQPLGRTHSNQSSLASSMKSGNTSLSGLGGIIHHVNLSGKDKNKDRDQKKNRRTPNAPSGAYSVASTSTSESDGFFPPSGPILGKMIRGPMKNRHGGPVVGGVVFGRDLKTAVQQTKSHVDGEPANRRLGDRERMVRELESRELPALVMRCAQHILIWGVQEEGLFRVSGRASHVSKLRSEFDTGVDYDLTDCAPGDLDPHAVASVFKAYLRELPEPILTQQLQPLFEAASSKELATNPPEAPSAAKMVTRGPGLPSGPKGNYSMAMRKPPSLSTLAMPTFTGITRASQTLVNALRTLIKQLPIENRDLVRTVVELMKATAKASKETKMPLSNLMLVFCPSLNMSPPLLKVLCELEGLWDGVPDADEVIDIRRKTVIDISRRRDLEDDADANKEDSTSPSPEIESQSVQSFDNTPSDGPSSDYHASAENSLILEEVHRRERSVDRQNIPTVYLDTQSRFSSSSAFSDREGDSGAREPIADHDSITSTSPSNNIALDHYPPPLTFSSESVATPVSSGHPSLASLPLDSDIKDEHILRKKPSHMELPNISEQGLPHPQRMDDSLDSSHIRFPSSSAQPPHPSPKKRRSIPILSLPSFSPITPPGSEPSPPPNVTSSPLLRGKKPSLRRLFTKRSMASLTSNSSNSPVSKSRVSAPLQFTESSSPYSPQPLSASDSSISTPLSAVTAPSSTSLLPPVLDTPIEGSSLSLDLGLDLTANSADDLPSQFASAPITDTSFYASALSSQASFSPQSDSTNMGSPRGRLLSTASSNHLGLLEDEKEDDWSQSVLIAVGATTTKS